MPIHSIDQTDSRNSIADASEAHFVNAENGTRVVSS